MNLASKTRSERNFQLPLQLLESKFNANLSADKQTQASCDQMKIMFDCGKVKKYIRSMAKLASFSNSEMNWIGEILTTSSATKKSWKEGMSWHMNEYHWFLKAVLLQKLLHMKGARLIFLCADFCKNSFVLDYNKVKRLFHWVHQCNSPPMLYETIMVKNTVIHSRKSSNANTNACMTGWSTQSNASH